MDALTKYASDFFVLIAERLFIALRRSLNSITVSETRRFPVSCRGDSSGNNGGRRRADSGGAKDQLEGQLGTLRINLARLATKEVYWVFSGGEVDLRINDPSKPCILVLASSPENQEINSTCYALIINRLTKLINRKGRLPCALIVDELPTLYIHRLENLLATARSNKVAVLLGLQELPQFRQLYGKLAAETICAVVANVISGQVRNKETLEWLQEVFGKIKQLKKGINLEHQRYSVNTSEQMDYVIPAAKMAGLSTGMFVGSLGGDINNKRTILFHANINGKQFSSKEYVPNTKQSEDLINHYQKIQNHLLHMS